MLHGPLPSRRRAPPLRVSHTAECGRGDGGAPSDLERASGRLAPLLDTRWRPVFSLKPGADEGRFLTVRAEQQFRRDGSFTNAIRLLGLKFVFAGTYTLTGSATTLVIERLRLKILGLPLPSIDVREGRGIRGLIERARGRRKDGSKRPNVYSWCYADDEICVARGSSGSVAVWVRA